jgi:hypothetical protein
VNITPRKAEVQALVELLESDQYASADALAKAMFKRIYELFLDRDWHLYAFQWLSGGHPLLWGPFTSEAEVARFAAKMSLGPMGRHGVMSAFSPNRQLQIVLDADKKPDRNPICDECGHPKGLHEHKGAGGRCVWRNCKCPQHVLRKEA